MLYYSQFSILHDYYSQYCVVGGAARGLSLHVQAVAGPRGASGPGRGAQLPARGEHTARTARAPTCIPVALPGGSRRRRTPTRTHRNPLQVSTPFLSLPPFYPLFCSHSCTPLGRTPPTTTTPFSYIPPRIPAFASPPSPAPARPGPFSMHLVALVSLRERME